MEKITDNELLELTEKIMVTTKYIQMKNKLIECLNQLNCFEANQQKDIIAKLQEVEKFVFVVINDCFFNNDKIPQPLFLEIKNLVNDIKNKLRDLKIITSEVTK